MVTFRIEGGDKPWIKKAKARLERSVREINAAQSKAIILKNDLFNDFELEDFENDTIRYVNVTSIPAMMSIWMNDTY